MKSDFVYEMKNQKGKGCLMTKVVIAGILIMFAIVGAAWSQPVNDNFADAIELTSVSGEITGSNLGATQEPGEPNHVGISNGQSVWWKWTAPKTEYFLFMIQPINPSWFFPSLTIYTGSEVDNLTEVLNNWSDDNYNWNNHLIFKAQAGSQYYIAVDGTYGTYGEIALNWKKAVHPENNDFANAAELTGESGETTGSNIGEDMDATKEPDEPDHAGNSGGKSVWWKWIAPETEYFYFDTHGSDFDTLLAVYTGLNLSNLTEVAANDDDDDESISKCSGLKFQAQTGIQYYIAVDGKYGDLGEIVLNWRKAIRPVNDNFSDAIELTGVSGETTGSNIDATQEPDEPNHADNGGGASVWWQWTAPETGYFHFDTYISGFKTILAIYTGSDVSSLTEVISGYGQLNFQAYKGVQYYIAVDGRYGDSGEIVMTWRKALRPENDDFADATELTGVSGQTSGSNVGRDMNATKEPGEQNHAGNSGGKSVWWHWTAPETGYFRFDTYGSDFNTLLGVYIRSDCGNLKEVNSNDDDGSDNQNSGLTFQAEAGVLYYIAVDGYYGDTGEIILNWRKAARPENDDFANAVELTGVSGEISCSNKEATREPGELNHAGKSGGKSVWYRWTAPESGYFRFDTHGSDFNTLFAIYTGSDFGSLIEVIGDRVNTSLSFQAEAGILYYIAVDGWHGDSGDILLNWEIALRAESVSPNRWTAGEETQITVTGSAFDEDTRVSINSYEISLVTVDSGTVISLMLPNTFGPGKYSLEVFNETESYKLSDAITIIPDWTPKSGQLSMNLYGKVYTEGIEINASGYLLAAFGPDGESDCRGITNLTGEQEYNFDIVSDTDGEKITFKIWDEKDGKIYKVRDTAIFEAGASAELNPDKRLLTLESVYPLTAEFGKDSEAELRGSGFDENTRITMYPDIGNKHAIIGTLNFPNIANDIVVQGTLAFVVCGDEEDYSYESWNGLKIIDISDSDNPEVIGSLEISGSAKSIAISGSVAYLAAGNLYVIDVSNPTNSKIISILGTPGEANDISISGSTAYITDGDLQIIDITEPQNPEIIGSLNTPNTALSVMVSGKIAYISEDGILQIADVSMPENPFVISSVEIEGVFDNASEGIAYVVCGTSDETDKKKQLQLIDVNDPANPKITGYADMPNSALSISVSEKFAFVATGRSGLQIINMSNPAAPEFAGYIHVPFYATSIMLSENIAFIAGWDKEWDPEQRILQITDLSNLTTTASISLTDIPGDANDIVMSGNTAFVVWGGRGTDDRTGGLKVINISDPTNPIIIASVDMPTKAFSIALEGTTAYVTCTNYYYSMGGDGITIWDESDNSLQIIDVSSPINPNIIGSVSIPCIIKVAVKDAIAYVTRCGGYGLQSIDVSNPSDPIMLSSIGIGMESFFGMDIVIEGSTAYATSDSLDIIDINDPANPAVIIKASYPCQDYFACFHSSVAVSDNTLFIGTPYSLSVIDIADLENAAILANMSTPGIFSWDIEVSGNSLFITNGLGGLRMIDMINLSKPMISATFDIPGYARNVKVSGNLAYIAAGEAGLVIIPLPVELDPLSVNSETSISVTLPGSEIGNAGYHTLRVFNGEESYELPGAVFFSPSGGTSCNKKGDIDGDGEIGIADAIAILKILSGVSVQPVCPLSVADANGDEKLGLEDVVYILQKIASK